MSRAAHKTPGPFPRYDCFDMPGVGEGHRLLKVFLNSISVSVLNNGAQIDAKALEETRRILAALPRDAPEDVLRMFVEVRDLLQARISRRGVKRPRCTNEQRDLLLRLVSCVKSDWKAYSRGINAEIVDAPVRGDVCVRTSEQGMRAECDYAYGLGRGHPKRKRTVLLNAIAKPVEVIAEADPLAEELARLKASHRQLKMAYDALLEEKERSVAYSEYLLDYITDRQLGSAAPRHKDQMQNGEEVAFGGISHDLLVPYGA